MNQSPILDDLKNIPKEKSSFRILAIVLEIIPILILLLSAIEFEELRKWLLFLPIYYFLLSWYFFKASKFKILDILIAEIGGFIILSGSLGFLFLLESWQGASKLILFSSLLGFVLIAYLFYRLITIKNDPLEYRFSLKLISRLFPVCSFTILWSIFIT